MATDLNYDPENCVMAVTLENGRDAGPSNTNRHRVKGKEETAHSDICHCWVKKWQMDATWYPVLRRNRVYQSYKEANPAGNLRILHCGISLALPMAARLAGGRELLYVL
jgi:hypothetical protein